MAAFTQRSSGLRVLTASEPAATGLPLNYGDPDLGFLDARRGDRRNFQAPLCLAVSPGAPNRYVANWTARATRSTPTSSTPHASCLCFRQGRREDLCTSTLQHSNF
jgi:hypothetical protein